MWHRIRMRSVNPPDDPAYARFHFDAAREFPSTATQLAVSGQIGNTDGNMAAQITGALDALETVLTVAGYRLVDIAKLGIYTTDINGFIAEWAVIRDRFAPGAVPPNTLLQFTRLANPRSIVEIDALAAR
jgi:enamine deaminase RidA (YjgF/YER057c/UK114 family)